ncbi:phosphoadenosine phosphosulfate reductase family protein [Candidatus Magnetaquicoccus inordinatus]|uniref:phosphoadenosine phosphosulfate reductase domain-containing protein n=1 Tax=Candidatus Magnetaquicoccus inordinatus TaxID=2496818 RepID=UPI00102BE930|nr:phosphoadenosine phosphosulfate reductase family protein [Candidatus Magnetaquicoccus inordinatus]
MSYWLSYGGGVNSTALAVMIVSGRLPEYPDVRFIFSDTMNEQPETYLYIEKVFVPYLREHGRNLIIVKPKETVLERWQRYKVTGSRQLRTCTDHGKIRPMQAYIRPIDDDPHQIIGIDAGEPHRAKPANKKKGEFPKHYPLVDLGIDRDGCKKIIQQAGLCVPKKSGCWHCPFMRVREILALATERPEDFHAIIQLEADSHQRMREAGKLDGNYYHWRDKPATYWLDRATEEAKQLSFEFDDLDPTIPCSCYD